MSYWTLSDEGCEIHQKIEGLIKEHRDKCAASEDANCHNDFIQSLALDVAKDLDAIRKGSEAPSYTEDGCAIRHQVNDLIKEHRDNYDKNNPSDHHEKFIYFLMMDFERECRESGISFDLNGMTGWI